MTTGEISVPRLDGERMRAFGQSDITGFKDSLKVTPEYLYGKMERVEVSY